MNLFQKMFIRIIQGGAKNHISQQTAENNAEAQKRRENTICSLHPKVDLPYEKPESIAFTPENQKSIVAAVEKIETVSEKAEIETIDDTKYETPTILRPTQFKAVPQKIPAVRLTSKEAVEMGYSFRKSSKSVKITGFRGSAPQKLIIPCSIASLPVEEICSEVFMEAELNELFIPDSIRKLGKEVFRRSTVKSVVFGEGLSSISEKAFMGCVKLEQVVLPTTLRHIGNEAFWQCYALKHIDFPKKVKDLEDYSFGDSGLESFGVENENNRITNANAFYQTQMYWKYDIISTSLLINELKVLRVSTDKALKLDADKVQFLPHSILHGAHLDLTECRKVSFWRMARSREWYDYRYNDKCIIKLPDSSKNDSLAFLADYVEVYDKFDNKISHDVFNVSAPICSTDPYCYDVNYSYIPQYGLKTKYKKIKITSYTTIAANAIDSSSLEEIEIAHFNPEGCIFTNNCFNLRKVSWTDGKNTVTKYLPPIQLVEKHLKLALLNAFSPCSAPHGRMNKPYLPGYKRTVFNREVIDSLFRERKISSRNNPYIKRTTPPWSKGNNIFTVSNRFKALVAVDVLRSDKMPHEPDTKMYSDFLKSHRGFCHKFFAQISDAFPEYTIALKNIEANVLNIE